MKHRIAFAGFRHPHILAPWQSAQEHPDCEIVGAWEEHQETREQLSAKGEVVFTHDSFDSLLDSGCDIVAIGDVYARRGALAIAALRAGKHVISDKPICTELSELDEIERLATEKKLSIGCQLDLVEIAQIQQLKAIVGSGELGRICTITISAQHPLRLEGRAKWYFDPGAHGGTINDIGIHAFDMIPWLTGSSWQKVLSSREWNAKAEPYPHFQDCAQFHALLENGASCFVDVSYLGPDRIGYDLPQYWRILVHGTRGVAECSYQSDKVFVATDEDVAPRHLAEVGAASGRYLTDFLSEIAGSPLPDGLTTARVLTSSRRALEAQRLASQ